MSLSKLPGYSLLMQELSARAYRIVNPTIEPYMPNRETAAFKLYSYVIKFQIDRLVHDLTTYKHAPTTYLLTTYAYLGGCA